MLAEHNLRCCAPNQPLDPFRMATLCVIPNTGALLQLRSAVTSEASRACVGFGWNGIYFYLRRVNIFARARHDTARHGVLMSCVVGSSKILVCAFDLTSFIYGTRNDIFLQLLMFVAAQRVSTVASSSSWSSWSSWGSITVKKV